MARLTRAGMALAAGVLIGGPAWAADLPQPAAPVQYQEPAPVAQFDWSGFYMGGQLGWGWSDFNTNNSATGKFNSDASGINGGVHAGYNFAVTPNIVLGAEADFSLSDSEKRRTVSGVNVKTKSDWNSTFRARAGWTFDRFMVYGTGGLALADINVRANGDGASKTAVGWTAGAGVEGAVSDNVTARLEYLYQDFGRESFSVNGSKYKTDLSNNIARFGVSYKF